MVVEKDEKCLRGGLGDIFLKLDNINPDQSYVVFSYTRQSEDLVKLYTKNYRYLEMNNLKGRAPNEVESSPYPTIKIPEESIKKARGSLPRDKILIGIHPIGSKPSRVFDRATGRPQKLMTPKFINSLLFELVGKDREFLIFCSPDEKPMYDGYGVTVVSEPYIWDCIAYVSMCDLVIAVDSAIKTFSAVMHIPTIVVLGDYEDEPRRKFIEPYNEITPVKFIDIDDVIEEVLELSKNILNKT